MSDEYTTGKNAHGFPEEGCPYCGSEKLRRQPKTVESFREWFCVECESRFHYNSRSDIYTNPDGTKIEEREK
jgi:transposase-like protein